MTETRDADELLRLNVIKADPVLRLIAAQKGFEDGLFGFLDGWTIFKIFMKLPAAVRDDGGTFQAHPAEGDPDVLEIFMGRQLSEIGEMGFRDTRAVGLHFVFHPSGKPAATPDPGEGPDDPEDPEDEEELWSADFDTLEEFFAAVEESEGFRTACTRAMIAVSFHSQEEV